MAYAILNAQPGSVKLRGVWPMGLAHVQPSTSSPRPQASGGICVREVCRHPGPRGCEAERPPIHDPLSVAAIALLRRPHPLPFGHGRDVRGVSPPLGGRAGAAGGYGAGGAREAADRSAWSFLGVGQVVLSLECVDSDKVTVP
jgi:hypothetical protein